MIKSQPTDGMGMFWWVDYKQMVLDKNLLTSTHPTKKRLYDANHPTKKRLYDVKPPLGFEVCVLVG